MKFKRAPSAPPSAGPAAAGRCCGRSPTARPAARPSRGSAQSSTASAPAAHRSRVACGAAHGKPKISSAATAVPSAGATGASLARQQGRARLGRDVGTCHGDSSCTELAHAERTARWSGPDSVCRQPATRPAPALRTADLEPAANAPLLARCRGCQLSRRSSGRSVRSESIACWCWDSLHAAPSALQASGAMRAFLGHVVGCDSERGQRPAGLPGGHRSPRHHRRRAQRRSREPCCRAGVLLRLNAAAVPLIGRACSRSGRPAPAPLDSAPRRRPLRRLQARTATPGSALAAAGEQRLTRQECPVRQRTRRPPGAQAHPARAPQQHQRGIGAAMSEMCWIVSRGVQPPMRVCEASSPAGPAAGLQAGSKVLHGQLVS